MNEHTPKVVLFVILLLILLQSCNINNSLIKIEDKIDIIIEQIKKI